VQQSCVAIDIGGWYVGLTTTAVELRIQYDYGVVRTFTGSLSNPSHLSGIFDDGTSGVVFVRR
jgi:hypothetical protein